MLESLQTSSMTIQFIYLDIMTSLQWKKYKSKTQASRALFPVCLTHDVQSVSGPASVSQQCDTEQSVTLLTYRLKSSSLAAAWG